MNVPMLDYLASILTPRELIDLLEPYVEAARGQLLHEMVERGNYGARDPRRDDNEQFEKSR